MFVYAMETSVILPLSVIVGSTRAVINFSWKSPWNITLFLRSDLCFGSVNKRLLRRYHLSQLIKLKKFVSSLNCLGCRHVNRVSHHCTKHIPVFKFSDKNVFVTKKKEKNKKFSFIHCWFSACRAILLNLNGTMILPLLLRIP